MSCRPITSLLSSLRMVTLAAVTAVASLTLFAVVTSQEAYSDQTSSAPKADVDLDVLINAVSDFGRWQQHDDFGIVWIPNVDETWRPYTLGQWAYDEQSGWTWVSDEPFGWVVYHYGRWSRADDLGWFWVPGTTWAPAWVAWRETDEYVGWAPLPPDPPTRSDYRGPRYVPHTVIYEDPLYEPFWVFAAYSLFVEPHIYRHLAPRHRYHRFYRNSRRGPYARWRHRRVVNRGVSLRDVRRRAHRHVRPSRVVYSHDKRARRHAHHRGKRQIRQVYRPRSHAKQHRRSARQDIKSRVRKIEERRARKHRSKTHRAKRPDVRRFRDRRAVHKSRKARSERRAEHRARNTRKAAKVKKNARRHIKRSVKRKKQTRANQHIKRKRKAHRRSKARSRVHKRHRANKRGRASVKRHQRSRGGHKRGGPRKRR